MSNRVPTSGRQYVVETEGGTMPTTPPLDTAAIVAAAERLVRCKGRYHSEQNVIALAALFGVTLPPVASPTAAAINGGKTGSPPTALLQDDCRALSKALSNTPHARLHAKEAAEAIAASITQPEAVLRNALVELAATNAWEHFGECRAFDKYGKLGPIISPAEADSMARAALTAGRCD